MSLSISSIEGMITKLKQQTNRSVTKHVSIENDRTLIYGKQDIKEYIPTHTGNLAHHDDNFVRVIMGPYGSGKSTWAINEILQRSVEMPIWSNGRRRSRWAIVRNTSGELQSTTLQTWLSWFGELGDIQKRQKPILTYEHYFNDGHGIVELELIFIALDREEDVRKIKSLELTGCYINELSEVPEAALSHMKGRVNRYPSHHFCPNPYWAGIIADTNPPDEDHWIYKLFEEKSIPSYKLFKQPPGLLKDQDSHWIKNNNADNVTHLPDNYYTNLAEGQTSEFIKVFCLGQYGSVGLGKLVYPEFNADAHIVDHIEAIQGELLYLGWDFGLTPACIVTQLSARGQLLVLKEYIGEDIGIKSFAESVVIPGIVKDFPYCKIGKSFGDPSGNKRNEIIEEMSCIGELNSLGINTVSASTNDISARLASVRYFLNKMIDGKPSIVMSKKGCMTLYKGFTKDYVYQRVAVRGEERYKDKPDKNYVSHIHDALQYVCMEFASDRIIKDKTAKKEIDMFNPVFRWQ